MEAKNTFYFHTRHNLIYLTGKKAKNLKELLAGIKEARGASIYYHTHHYLQQHEYLSPEPPNDFAHWIKNVYQDEVLGEQIASIDLREFNKLKDIQAKLIEVIENMMNNPDFTDHNVPAGYEFYFMRAQTFVFPTRFESNNLSGFKDCLQSVTLHSIYFHMFESRLRSESDMCDFSLWLRDSLGEEKLAKAFNSLDPYTLTLENLRTKLVNIIEKRLKEIKDGKN